MADDDFDVDTGTDKPDDAEEKDADKDEDTPALRDDGKPFTTKDLAALKESLVKARRDARAAKRQAQAPKEQEGEDTASKAELETARQDAERYKQVGLRQAAKAAFAEAGLSLTGNQFSRAFKMLDLDDLTIGKDGEVEGLDDQIDEIKDDFPSWFEDKKTKRTPRVDHGRSNGDEGGKKQRTSAEEIAYRMFNPR